MDVFNLAFKEKLKTNYFASIQVQGQKKQQPTNFF